MACSLVASAGSSAGGHCRTNSTVHQLKPLQLNCHWVSLTLLEGFKLKLGCQPQWHWLSCLPHRHYRSAYRPFPIVLGSILLLDTSSIFYPVEVRHFWVTLEYNSCACQDKFLSQHWQHAQWWHHAGALL